MQVWRFADGFTEKDFYLPHTLASLPQHHLYLLHVQFRINPFIMMASEVDGNMISVVEFLNFEKGKTKIHTTRCYHKHIT